MELEDKRNIVKNTLKALLGYFWPMFPWVRCLSIYINLLSRLFSVSGHPAANSCRQVFVGLVLYLEGAHSVQLVMFGDGYEADVI